MGDSPRLEELRRRVLMDPASIAFAALAEEYRRAGRYEEAIATCQAGLQRHPAYLSARVTLGRAMLEMGQYDEARSELEHVLRTAPENLAAIRGLAEIHHRRGELPEALEHYRSALNVARHDLDLQETVAAISRQVAPEAPPPERPPAEARPVIRLEQLPPVVPPAIESVEPPSPVEAAPPVEEPAADPALAGLERLLAAILRAKASSLNPTGPSPFDAAGYR